MFASLITPFSRLRARAATGANDRKSLGDLALDADALRRQRLRLRDLDDRLLADIGLTRDEAQEEARRPLWDVPTHWRR